MCTQPKKRPEISSGGTWMAMVLLGLSVLAAPAPVSASQGQSQSQALINQYCAGCHNQKLKSGGIALAELDLSNIAGNSSTLEKVLRKVHSGEMPPPGMPRPDAA